MQQRISNTSSSPAFPPTERRGATKGRGFFAGWRDVAHFITLSFWESREAIAAFAGTDIEVAKYYPEDEKYLLEFEPTVAHYELFQ